MSLDVGGGGGGDARGALGTIKDWVQAKIAEALRTHIGRTWLFVNGVGVAARHKIDVQMTGATGEDHPELDLVRAILPEAGGGGGGGVWTQIAQQIAVGGESTLDFTAVPATYDTLVAVGDSICAETDTTSAGEPIRVEFNEWDGSDYLHREHYFRSIGAGDAHGMQGATSQALEVGRAPWSAANGVGSFVAWFPGYAVAGTYKNVHSSGGYGYGNGVNGLHTSGFARLNLARSDVIDHLLFFMGAWSGSPTRTFAAGSRITLYGLKDGSGGGSPTPCVWNEVARYVVPAGSGENNVLFDSLPQTYDIIAWRISGQQVASGGVEDVYLYINGDTGNNYVVGNHTTAKFTHSNSELEGNLGLIGGFGFSDTSPPGYGSIQGEIQRYAVSGNYKLWMSESVFGGDSTHQPTGYGTKGWWNGTDPITSLTFWCNDNFAPGTIFIIYGLKNGSGGISVPSPYVKLAEVGPIGSDQAVLRLPTSGSLPTDAYDTYVVRAKVLATSSTRQLLLQINDDDGASSYNYITNRFDGSGAFGPSGTQGDDVILVCSTVESTAGDFAVVEGTIQRPLDTDNHKVVDFKSVGPNNGSQVAQVNPGIGVWLGTDAITSLTFSLQSGFDFAPGSWVAVYGVRG